MTIRTLQNIRFGELYNAFSRAFENYEIQLNEEQLRTMLVRRGFVPELSFAAFENDTIMSFTFNGIGIYNGIKTAYDTGTGTIKEFLGKNLASEVFRYSIPFLTKSGIEQYLLEVLQHNTKAVNIYRKNGFEVSREFNYFVQNKYDVVIRKSITDPQYSIRPAVIEQCRAAQMFMDFKPSWQNSFEAVERKAEDFLIFGAFFNTSLAGYCIFEPVSGDVTQICVDPVHRRKGVGSLLLKEAARHNRHDSIKVINTEIACDSITGFLESVNIKPKGKQFEMIRKL